jgi:drug/metabolite transporter (DMT)-like permease
MLDLALSVLCSSLIFVIFKLFDVFKIQTFYAIVTNYIVACITGVILYQEKVDVVQVYHSNWFWGTLALGILFILVFNIMAKTSQEVGVSVASVATKMSLVIPVILGVILYQESLSALKILGILLALAAVYFTSIKEKGLKFSKKILLLPILLFMGSGIIDASINYFRETHLTTAEFPLFSSTVFAAAATIGLLFILLKAIKQSLKINFKNILGGIALGIPNYFSIFFLLRALQNDQLNSASVFTINNVAIVMFSTLLGIILFKEKLIPKNWAGIALAVISILLVALFY